MADDVSSADRERGLARLRLLDESAADEFVAALHEVAPELASWVLEFVYGRTQVRDELTPRERQLLTIATLAGIGGAERQLRFHVGGALEVGATPADVVEAVMHTAVYAGFPRALNAMEVVREVFAARDVVHDADA